MLTHTIIVKIVLALALVTCTKIELRYNCTKIHERYRPKDQQLNILPGKPSSRILLYWGSDPARAAAALFAIVLRNALGYELVDLRPGPLHLKQLTTHPKLKPFSQQSPWALYREIALVLSAAWEPALPPAWMLNKKMKYGLAGPRLEEFGSSPVPIQERLHVHVPDHFRDDVRCANVTQWYWYTNTSAFTHCGFDNTTFSGDYLKVYGLNPRRTVIPEIYVSQLRIHFDKLKDRKSLLQKLQMNQSFLFIDYDIWSGYPNVRTVELPPCVPSTDTTCLLEPDTAKAIRVGDTSILKLHAPRLFHLAYNFTPTLESIREILELESNPKNKSESNNVEKAACEWASEHYSIIDNWVQVYYEQPFEMLIFLCADDLEYEEYVKLLDILNNEVNAQTKHANFTIEFTKYAADCSDRTYLKDKLLQHLTIELIDGLMGAVIGDMEGIMIATDGVAWANLPMMLYNAGINAELTESTWVTARSSLSVAIAFHHFIIRMNWTRVAVISEDTRIAKEFADDLREFHDLVFHEYVIPQNSSLTMVEKVLQAIKATKTHIVLVNTNVEDAVVILSAADRYNMSSRDEYVWIIRERLPNNIILNIKYFTISSYCQNGKDVPSSKGRSDLRKKMDHLWVTRTWPSQAIALADAVLTLAISFQSVILKYPELRDEIHTDKFINLMETSLLEEPVKGLIQNLTYKGRSLEESLVFVEEWPDHQSKYKAQWRVNVTARTVRIEHEEHTLHFKPWRERNVESWSNSSKIWVVGLVVFGLMLIVCCIWYYLTKQNRNAQLSTFYKIKLANHLVNRATLNMIQELSDGDFNRKGLVTLRFEGAEKTVAIKELCEHKTKNGLLREACILTHLKHNHIIRFVGVCIDEEPPLVLTEVAFFGNLLQYLRARQYLAEASFKMELDDFCKEATHISAQALTKLAREAASALVYLSLRGVVHRDLCAANCVVDEHRSLKVTGFCLATEAADDKSEIPCRRHRPIIQGMAPESMLGNFSPASDVWSFGVLVLELVTLGADPYGNMSPSEIRKFVLGGGTPRLPHGASPLTSQLVQMCWRREPKDRPTAVELEASLTVHSTALSSALYEER